MILDRLYYSVVCVGLGEFEKKHKGGDCLKCVCIQMVLWP